MGRLNQKDVMLGSSAAGERFSQRTPEDIQISKRERVWLKFFFFFFFKSLVEILSILGNPKVKILQTY